MRTGATGTWLARIHSHQHSYKHVVRRASSAIIFSVHARSFRASVDHQTLRTCAHVIILIMRIQQGLVTQTVSQHNIFDSEILKNVSCAPDGIQTFVLWIWSLTLYPLGHPVPPVSRHCTVLPTFFLLFSCVQCFRVSTPQAVMPTLLRQMDMGSLT